MHRGNVVNVPFLHYIKSCSATVRLYRYIPPPDISPTMSATWLTSFYLRALYIRNTFFGFCIIHYFIENLLLLCQVWGYRGLWIFNHFAWVSLFLAILVKSSGMWSIFVNVDLQRQLAVYTLQYRRCNLLMSYHFLRPVFTMDLTN